MENEYTFLFKFDNLERRTITALGHKYTIAKESLQQLLALIMDKGNEKERERAISVDDKIAGYVPDDVFSTANDEELAKYVNEHFYHGELFEPDYDYIVDKVRSELCNATEKELATQIAYHIVDDVIEDIKKTSDHPEFNDSDIRIAIGRVLLNALDKANTHKKTIRFFV